MLHNWGAVSEFLAEITVRRRDDGLRCAGYGRSARDGAGRLRRCRAALRSADSLWRATATLQAYFPDFQCNLGLAYAPPRANGPCPGHFSRHSVMSGAEPFMRMSSILPDGGRRHSTPIGWPRRSRPSLAFAYEREGAALLRHGDPKGAIYRLRIAHLLSPRWADPAEGFGGRAGRRAADLRCPFSLPPSASPGAAMGRCFEGFVAFPRQKALTRSK